MPPGPEHRGPPSSAARERSRRPGGSPLPSRGPMAGPPARPSAHEAAAARGSRGRKDRRAPPPRPGLPPPPGARRRARPPPRPEAPKGGSHSLVLLGAEDGGQILRHFPPAAADSAADCRRHCPTPAGDVTLTRRPWPRPARRSALPNREKRCLRVGGAWSSRAGLSSRPRSPRAACGAPCRRVAVSRAPQPRPRQASRANRAGRGRRWARLLHAVARGWVRRAPRGAGAPPSPRLPGGPALPLGPFFGEDPSSTALGSGEWSRGAPGGPRSREERRAGPRPCQGSVPKRGHVGGGDNLVVGGLSGLFLALHSLVFD